MKITFIIDTNSYAGNFEREMCGYLTGRVGECGVGDNFAEFFHKEETLDFDNVIDVEDEGCARPCSIQPSPNYFNTGMGKHYHISEENDKERILNDYYLSVKGVYEGYMAQPKGYREIMLKQGLTTYANGWTLEACNKEIARHEKTIDAAKNATTFQKYPAYNSVGIFFDTMPTQEQIDLMKKRAVAFVSLFLSKKKYGADANFKVEGFRIETQKTIKKFQSV